MDNRAHASGQATRISHSGPTQKQASNASQPQAGDILHGEAAVQAQADYWAGIDVESLGRCGCPGCVKAAQEREAAAEAPTPQFLLDDVADDTTTETYIDANEGQTIESQIDSPGDQDYFGAQLSAGETYEFTLAPDDTSGAGPDLILEIYDSEGALITTQDGGSFGEGEAANFTATEAGSYYINIKGWTPADVGGYSLTAAIGNDDNPDPNIGTPLDAIDWGTRVDTDGVVNGDGDEVIHVYFAKNGEVTPHPITEMNVNSGWQQFEKDAAFVSFELYENIINVDFVEVDSQAEADFIFGISPSAPALLGAMSPPGETTEGAAWFNNAGVGWDEEGLQQGGFGFITFTHELGHGMGMAHPHDNGGNSTVMNGVESDTDSGEFSLNQGVFTVMTYNDGWPDGPYGKSPSNSYGFQGTLMGLDIAVLQQKYGANMDFNTGNDSYVINDKNGPGTFYSCIWDAGGDDTIVAKGARGANIDLRTASLDYEEGGGGWVSYNFGIHGGFTIANGVVVENAKGGMAGDVLSGNEADNRLYGRDGGDQLFGQMGNDILYGGLHNDLFDGGDGVDTASFFYAESVKLDLSLGVYQQTGEGKDRFVGIENLIGSRGADVLIGSYEANDIRGGASADRIEGGAGGDDLFGQTGADVLTGGLGSDILTGGEGADIFIFNTLEDLGVRDGDRIRDLADEDTINLRHIDADASREGDQDFQLTEAFTHTAGEAILRYNAQKDRTYLQLDVDGDAKADMTVVIYGDHTEFTNFVL